MGHFSRSISPEGGPSWSRLDPGGGIKSASVNMEDSFRAERVANRRASSSDWAMSGRKESMTGRRAFHPASSTDFVLSHMSITQISHSYRSRRPS